MLATMTMQVHRSGQIADRPRDRELPRRFDAVIPNRQMHITNSVFSRGRNVGPSTVDGNDRLHAALGKFAKRGSVSRRGATDQSRRYLDDVFQFAGIRELGRRPHFIGLISVESCEWACETDCRQHQQPHHGKSRLRQSSYVQKCSHNASYHLKTSYEIGPQTPQEYRWNP